MNIDIKEINQKINNNIKALEQIDPFDDIEGIENIENDIINYLNSLLENKTIKLDSKMNNKFYCIIHRSTKKDNIIQISYFKNNIAISDQEKSSYKDALIEVYKSYLIKEVI